MPHLAAVSHDCRPFLRLKADEIEADELISLGKLRGPGLARTIVVIMRQLADDISPGGYVQDVYTNLHNQETRVLRDLGSAEPGAHKEYLERLITAIDRVRMVMREVDVETGKRRVR